MGRNWYEGSAGIVSTKLEAVWIKTRGIFWERLLSGETLGASIRNGRLTNYIRKELGATYEKD